MNYLSIDTSSKLCSTTLFYNRTFFTEDVESTNGHTTTLSSLCDKLGRKKIHEIDFIALSIGPGSYSGLRIGSSFAKGLALSLNKPIVPISTFEGMNLSIKDNDKYYISIYSHRDYAFYQLYNAGKIVENSKCSKIENMKIYKIYGYDFDDNLKSNRFVEIKPSSKNIGQIALNNFSNLVANKINDVRPLYLEMER